MAPYFSVAIPIAVPMIIDGGTASSLPFQRTPTIDHHHAGIVFTLRLNTRSRCAGNREHHAPEYAGKLAHLVAYALFDAFSLAGQGEEWRINGGVLQNGQVNVS